MALVWFVLLIGLPAAVGITMACIKAFVPLTLDPSPESAQREGIVLGPSTLSPVEREHQRRTGLRQGEAAGIRAAARIEAREAARRTAIREAAERFAAEMREDSLRAAGVPERRGT